MKKIVKCSMCKKPVGNVYEMRDGKPYHKSCTYKQRVAEREKAMSAYYKQYPGRY